MTHPRGAQDYLNPRSKQHLQRIQNRLQHHSSKVINTSRKAALHHNKIVHRSSKVVSLLNHKVLRKVVHQTQWNQPLILMTISRSSVPTFTV